MIRAPPAVNLDDSERNAFSRPRRGGLRRRPDRPRRQHLDRPQVLLRGARDGGGDRHRVGDRLLAGPAARERAHLHVRVPRGRHRRRLQGGLPRRPRGPGADGGPAGARRRNPRTPRGIQRARPRRQEPRRRDIRGPRPMNRQSLHRIERMNYVLGGILVAATGVLGTGEQLLGALVGVVLSAVNFSLARRLVERMLVAAQGGAGAAGGRASGVALLPKMAAVMGATAAALVFLPISAIMLA